jgi:hypothetical protein
VATGARPGDLVAELDRPRHKRHPEVVGGDVEEERRAADGDWRIAEVIWNTRLPRGAWLGRRLQPTG